MRKKSGGSGIGWLLPALAATIVMGCVIYFNLAEWREPTFTLDPYGWPFRYRKIKNEYGHDEMPVGSFVSLTLNCMTLFVLTLFTAFGIYQLQRINRSVKRFHLQTLLLLVLTAGLFMALNLHAAKEWDWLYTYGWPYRAVLVQREGLIRAIDTSIYWNAVGKNFFVAAYALFIVAIASESWIARMDRRQSQMTEAPRV